MDPQQQGYINLSPTGVYLPREERLEIPRQNKGLLIGLPRESTFQENRIALVPDAVGVLTANGHRVRLETRAGERSGFSDNEYATAGAQIVYSKEEVFDVEVLLKVAPPGDEEYNLLKNRQVLISSLNWSVVGQDLLRKLMAKKLTGIAFEFLRDKEGSFPIMRAMSEIAGNSSIMIASRYLSEKQFGKGIMLGGLPGIAPTEVVILGAGTVGEYAARAALGLGSMVKVFDNNLYKLRRLQSVIPHPLFTSILEPAILLKALKSADVVIGAVYSTEKLTPCFVPESYVSQMKEGAVIIDVSIDHGGCFETSRVTTHENPAYLAHGVIHYCVPNIPSMVPHTASLALSNVFGPLMRRIGDVGGVENAIRGIPGMREGVYLFNGTPVNKLISDFFSLPYQNIDLLLAAWQ